MDTSHTQWRGPNAHRTSVSKAYQRYIPAGTVLNIHSLFILTNE